MSASIGRLSISPMTQGEAEAVAGWSYDPPYGFYDARADESDLAELLDPAQREDRYFSASREGGELIGSFVFKRDGDVVVVWLGLRPDLTGLGLGPPFVELGLDFARERFAPRHFRLTVAEFNERAIAVYCRVGSTVTRAFVHETNGGLFPFVEMERPA